MKPSVAAISKFLAAVVVATATAGCGTDSPTLPTSASAVSVSGIVPASGPTAGGTPVTIAGVGFGTGASVTFGTLPATGVVVVNSTTILATVPAQPAGAVDVHVTNINGQGGKSLVPYTYGALNLQGNWSGITAQGLPISMSVNTDNAVTMFMVRFALHTSSCSVTDNLTASVIPAPIINGSFRAGADPFSVISGTVGDSGLTASGTVSLLITAVPGAQPCAGSVMTSWTMTKR